MERPVGVEPTFLRVGLCWRGALKGFRVRVKKPWIFSVQGKRLTSRRPAHRWTSLESNQDLFCVFGFVGWTREMVRVRVMRARGVWKRGSNPLHPACGADALPNELFQTACGLAATERAKLETRSECADRFS